ncbi:hypothetical protein S7711_11245 [Stachybotrys chartarum IBT 7711]|uniref:Uncharacterized protein n=1 Tax=Stachybotrys chartarum (strain CBS 109288 / IBT 7711) TaxID=1280523 RepID=A0A084AS63_STACB|nr:hypothetical protein S7711_11245 [Stachybotrys chartarum IBT 7711]
MEDGGVVVVSTLSSPAASADDPLIPRDFLRAIFTQAFLEAGGDVRRSLALSPRPPPCKQPPGFSGYEGQILLAAPDAARSPNRPMPQITRHLLDFGSNQRRGIQDETRRRNPPFSPTWVALPGPSHHM